MREMQLMTTHRPLFPIDWRYLWDVTLDALIYADDVKIRAFMALGSLGWTLSLLLEPSMLERSIFEWMRWMPAWLWAALFFLHGIGAIWRIYERKERIGWALAINGLGFGVWTASTLAQGVALHEFTPPIALEAFASLFMGISFVVSGFDRSRTA